MSRNSRSRPLAPTTALDHALEALAAGDADRALRWAVPALDDEGSGAAAADLVGRALLLAKRPELAAEAFELAVKLLTAHNLVPHAVAAALALRELSGSDDAVRAVARAFGADARGESGDVKPPALKSEPITPLGDDVKGNKLIDRAVAALAAVPRPAADAPGSGARLPLWSALPSGAFERFARALTVRVCAPGARLLTEGEVGHSAFVLARGEVRVTRAPAAAAAAAGEASAEAGDAAVAADGAIELAVLGAGAIVGEMALVTEAPRAATVTATRGALVLEAPRSALDQAAAEVPAVGEQVIAYCRRRLVDNVMRTSFVLREVPPEEREGLAQLFETRTFEPGDALIREGDTGAGLHLIAAGQVEVTRREESGDTLRIATLGPGHCVGEIALVLRRPATASVVATQPAVSLVLAADNFRETVRGRPNLLAKLYDLAVQREDETLSVVGQEAEEIEDVLV